LWFDEEPSPAEEPFWKWCLEEQFFKASLRHISRLFKGLFEEIGSLKNSGLKGSLRHLYRLFKELFKEIIFKEPWFERFFVEPEMVLLRHHSEEPFSVPDRFT